MPKISIMTPCYNSVAFISKTILSVRHQTFTDWEHIVVDDGSQDGSGDIVRSYMETDNRLRLIVQPNAGVCTARNRGFQASAPDSDYLLFLDADDLLVPEMLAEMIAYLDQHPEVGMLYCSPIFIDADGHELDQSRYPTGWSPRFVPDGLGLRILPAEEPETPFLSILGLATMVPSLTVLRRADYVRTPQWDESFGHMLEDADLFLHMALVSRVHYLPRHLVQYRRHSGQATSNQERYYAQEAKLYARWHTPQGLTPQQLAVVERAWRFREGRLLPYQGWIASRAFLRRGDLKQAVWYLLGAVRRYLMYLF